MVIKESLTPRSNPVSKQNIPTIGRILNGYGTYLTGRGVFKEYDLEEAIAQLTRLQNLARLEELETKLTLRIDLMSSADFKAGFSEALDQIDAYELKRKAELQALTKEESDGGE